MKYTVTGGSGFIGIEVVRQLLANGNEVTIADIREPKDTLLKQYFTFCDITDPFQVQSVIKGKDCIIHLAANPDPGLAEKNPRWDLNINVIGTLNVIDACKEHGVRMVFSSTAAVNYAPFSCYAISKKTAENYILRNINKGLNASILRFNNIYGPTQGLGYVIPDFIKKLRENKLEMNIRGTGLDQRDFVYIDDVISAIITVAKDGKNEFYEVGTGIQTSMIDLASLVGLVLNDVRPLIVPEKVVENHVSKLIAQDFSALKALGWKHKYSLQKGLKKVIEIGNQ